MSNTVIEADQAAYATEGVAGRPQTSVPRPVPKRRAENLGWFLTALYLAFAVWIGVDKNVLAMKADELGTFLGGIFAPLAFLWLVLGFKQQGEELRNSADALWLQGEELRNSVEQQRSMVGLTREQIDHMKSRDVSQMNEERRLAQPKWAVQGGGSGPYDMTRRKYDYEFLNTGANCTAVKVYIGRSLITEKPIVSRADAIKWALIVDAGSAASGVGEIHFVDDLGHQGSAPFAFNIAADGVCKVSLVPNV